MSTSKKAISTAKVAIIIVVIVAVIGAGVYFASTSSAPSSTSMSGTSGAVPQTLVIDDYTWPTRNLNQLYGPQYQPWPNWMEHAVYQPLVTTNITEQYAQNVINWIPDLATSWTISPDGATYTYNLRTNVTFSNGDPFNSYQVWAEFMGFYYLMGSTFFAGLNLFDFSNVNFGPAQIALLNSTGLANPTGAALAMMQNQSWPMYTTGPYQITFHLRAPFLFFNGVIGGGGDMGLIFDIQYVLDHGGFGTPAQINSYFDDSPAPGTGPYVVTEVVLNSHVTFQKNPNYWGNSLTPAEIAANPVLNPGQANTIVVQVKTDDLARYTDLSTGAAQIVAINTNDWNLVVHNPQYAYFVMPDGVPDVEALAMNTAIAPTNNVWVRRAIVHAINYTDVWAKAYQGEAAAFMGPETPNYGAYYDPGNLSPYAFNTTEALVDLAKAGYPNGTGLQSLTLRTVAGCSYCANAAQVIQSDLASVGITVNIVEVSSSTYWNPYGPYSTNLQNANQLGQLSFLGGELYAPDYLGAPDYWIGFVTNSSVWGNWAVYDNPKVDQDVSLLYTSANETQHISALTDAQQQIYNDAPYAWLGTYKLWGIDGSVVWNKSVIQSMLFEPNYGGTTTAPLLNTIVFT
jgi:ABC-type transport system substrate-binding protein